MADAINGNRSILVVGGGMSGLTAALEAAEAGFPVYIVEKEPYLGGRVARMNKYFPKLCPPSCGLEINFRRIKNNPLVRFFTMAEVVKVDGGPGDFDVQIRLRPRYVNEKCTGCGVCQDAATTEVANPFNYSLDKIKAIHLPHEFAFPMRYMLTPEVLGTDEATAIKNACPYDAVDLEMQPQEFDLKVAAIIWATGWTPYDASKILYYGFEKNSNVISNVMMERFAALNGPTGGQIVRPSDGAPVQKIAFIQCAGSRDENHLRHCSRFCCMGSLKQTHYVQEAFGDAGKSTIYYIDIRAIDRFEDFYQKVQANPNVSFVKSKVARITQDKDGNPVCNGVDVEGYKRYATAHDLVVLAVGMEPSVKGMDIPAEVMSDSSGFIMADPANAGIFGAGCATNALDVNRAVQSATAAALRAIQVVNKVARAEA